MAIHDQQQLNYSDGGFQKNISEGSLRMVLDNLQVTQYHYPQKSAVRELASNAIDAVRERNLARKIILGQEKVEDHYVQKEGPEYADSAFNPAYYNLDWLSNDDNIYITYVEGSLKEKPKIIIKDYGVGLGGKRLVGYFDLAYSTKRLSKFGLGKYGIGAKAALSTGAPFYTVKNRYNGKETHFDVYSYQVQPITPKFDLNTGETNPVTFLDNEQRTPIYYVETQEKNGLEVIIQTKIHQKQQYIDAVKSQLLYFDNVVFQVQNADGTVETIPVKANILYEDAIMILSDNTLYAKPHILINRVNYGKSYCRFKR